MRVRKYPRGMLPELMNAEWVDTTRRPYVKGDDAFIPVKETYEADQVLDEKKPYAGRGYQMLGDVVLLHGTPPTEKDIRDICGWVHPRGIVYISGYSGNKRIPAASVVYGECGEVCHREAGFVFHLNPLKVMFAMGNREEKTRISELIRKSGRDRPIRCADMFAGIGYFTIPAALQGASVHAMEINPDSFYYLEKNIEANAVRPMVTPEEGDCRDCLRGIYDHILMGHFDAPEYLADACAHVRAGTVLHVHTVGEQSEKISRTCAEAGYATEIIPYRVKKYAPGVWHMVHDVMIQ